MALRPEDVRSALKDLEPLTPRFVRMPPNQWRDWQEQAVDTERIELLPQLQSPDEARPQTLGPMRLIIDYDIKPDVVRFEDERGEILFKFVNVGVK